MLRLVINECVHRFRVFNKVQSGCVFMKDNLTHNMRFYLVPQYHPTRYSLIITLNDHLFTFHVTLFVTPWTTSGIIEGIISLAIIFERVNMFSEHRIRECKCGRYFLVLSLPCVSARCYCCT